MTEADPLAQPAGACNAELGWGLLTMSRAFGQWAAEAMADLPGGMRGHLVLSTISLGQPPSQLALANELGVDRTVMTYLLDELEEAGFVERRADPADRRARLIVITKAGSEALADYRERIRHTEQRLLATLSGKEALAFRTAVERVARASQLPGGASVCSAAVPD